MSVTAVEGNKTLRLPKFGLQVVAHRGARLLDNPKEIAPENTLPAFEAAAKRGVAIELDVIATQDGHVVVHHDDATGKIFTQPSGDKLVKHSTLAEVESARLNTEGHEADIKRMMGLGDRCGGHTYTLNPAFANTKIPKLSEVLDKLPDTHFYIELKTTSNTETDNANLERLVAQLIKEKNAYHRVTVISFNEGALRKINALDPAIKTALDVALEPEFEEVLGFWRLVQLRLAGIDGILPNYKGTTPKLVKQAHWLGLTVMPWVYKETRLEEEAMFPKLKAMGVDGIVTNAIERLQGFLETATKE